MAGLLSEELSAARRILDNIIFLEEIFRDRLDEEIPDVPLLELAKSFELKDGAPALAASH